MPIFVKFSTELFIKGLSKEKNHIGWVECLKASPAAQDNFRFYFERNVDGSSTDILRASAIGYSGTITVHFTGKDGKLITEVIFERALVSTYQASDQQLPAYEQFGVTFRKSRWLGADQKTVLATYTDR